MNWFSNLKIGKKLGLGFGLVLALTAVLGIFSILQLSKVNSSTVDIATNWLPSVRVLGKINFDTSGVRRDTLNYIVATDKRPHYEEKVNTGLQAVADDEKEYEPMISSPEEKALYQGFRESWDKYNVVRARVKELAGQNKNSEAIVLAQTEGSELYEAAAKFLNEDVALNDKGAKDAATQSANVYSSSRYWVIGLLIGTVVIGGLVATAIARSISSAASSMAAMIEEMAANNLTVRDMTISSHDEIGQAGIALNKMKNNLHQVIQAISGSSIHVASASEELSSTSQQITANSEETSAQAKVVSNATTQVSQNLQTVATGAEEMGASIKEIAKNASEAAKIATSAVHVAETTTATVSKLGE
ncbi:MAG: methyl-accepting chemotaxis protein, partial [Candidatus Sulfotelmatobacter sp.]